jgi:hypothetical protein
MFEPIRGGTRGGQAEFKWSDVSADKDREVCVFPMSLPPLNNSRLHRTTSAIVSMPLLAAGRKKRTFIGTIVILNHHKKSVRKRYVKSRRQRQRHYPSRCRPQLLFILPAGHSFTHTHTVGLGRQRKNHPRAHKARAQMRYPYPQHRRVGT